MKTTKVDTWLPIFSGFYGTIWESDGDEEMEIDNINEMRKEKGLEPITWDDIEWDYEGYKKAVVKGGWSFEKELEYMISEAKSAIEHELSTAKDSHSIQAL